MLSRRELLTSTGGGIVTLLLTPLINACSSDSTPSPSTSVGTTTPTPPGSSGCDGAGETSTVNDGHTHTLCVPASDLSRPPAAGGTYTTSTTSGHDHVVVLSQAQLATVASGGSVRITTSIVSGHTHDFSVQKAAVQSTPIPPPGPRYPMY